MKTEGELKGSFTISNSSGEVVLSGDATLVYQPTPRGVPWPDRFVNEDEHQSFPE